MRRKNKSKRRIKFSNKIRVFLNSVMQWILLVFVAFVFGYSFIIFCYQTINVIGPAMTPTLYEDEVVIVDKIGYKIHGLKRFDIIAFSRIDQNEYYDIKRVIGLPGETIKIHNGDIYIDDVRLTGLPFNDIILIGGIAEEGIKLANNEYFVLGDNINNSEDSRYTTVGVITKTEILGTINYRWSPKDKRGKIE